MAIVASMKPAEHAMLTSGDTEPVWIHTEPYKNRPQFSKLDKDIETDVCVIGAGIAGISTAYELVQRGLNVVLIEAREVLSGETGRTSGHLSAFFDDGISGIKKLFDDKSAKMAYDSHIWAAKHVGEVSRQLQIDCEYRMLPGYQISQYENGSKDHKDDMEELKDEVKTAQDLGIPMEFQDSLKIKGWTGSIDQQGGIVFKEQGAFHPTKYAVGIIKHLSGDSRFQCFTKTRAVEIKEKKNIPLIGEKHVEVSTLDGQTITCSQVVEATNAPLQKLAVVAQMEWMRTYCIAARVPKGSIEDCLLYDTDEAYKYVRLTHCDEEHDYLIVGGCDHPVGQEDHTGRLEELEKWTRERFTQVGAVDYQWSGQVLQPVDMMAYIGKNQGQDKVYIITGDSGNGLTHGVIASKLIADEITGTPTEWSDLYSPKRATTVLKSAGQAISHVLQVNSQYKRFLQSDIKDIEDLAPGEGGVLNPTTSKPIAVYKDEGGQVVKMSAICPHLKGVVCWNSVEKSWDCPIHGSRFSKEGVQVMGPAKAGLQPVDDAGEAIQQEAIKA